VQHVGGIGNAIERHLGERVEPGAAQLLEHLRRAHGLGVGEPPDVEPRERRHRPFARDGSSGFNRRRRDFERVRPAGDTNLARGERHRIGERFVERTERNADVGHLRAVQAAANGVGEHAQLQDVGGCGELREIVRAEPLARTHPLHQQVER